MLCSYKLKAITVLLKVEAVCDYRKGSKTQLVKICVAGLNTDQIAALKTNTIDTNALAVCITPVIIKLSVMNVEDDINEETFNGILHVLESFFFEGTLANELIWCYIKSACNNGVSENIVVINLLQVWFTYYHGNWNLVNRRGRIIALDEARRVRLQASEDVDTNTRLRVAEHGVQTEQAHSSSSEVIIYCRGSADNLTILRTEMGESGYAVTSADDVLPDRKTGKDSSETGQQNFHLQGPSSTADVVIYCREGVSGLDAQLTNVEPSTHESSKDESGDTAAESIDVVERYIGYAGPETGKQNRCARRRHKSESDAVSKLVPVYHEFARNLDENALGTDDLLHSLETIEKSSTHDLASDSDDVSEDEDIIDYNDDQKEKFKCLQSRMKGLGRRKRHFSEGDAQTMVVSPWITRYRYIVGITSKDCLEEDVIQKVILEQRLRYSVAA